jgi:hypothetical protein
MDEKTVTMMEGVAREWRVRVMDSAGNVLNPDGFSFYGAAADGVQVPRRMQVHVEGDVVVLVLPGLWMSGRCWRYQVMCQDVLTGVEWVLCQGDVVLERRVACNGPALHEDAVLVDAVLDSEMEKVDVYLGDSTAASAEAARLAVAARDGAKAGAARSVDAAAKAEALKGVALDAAAKAALSAEGAGESAQEAGDAAAEAAGCARDAEAKAAEAEASREAAEADAKLAGARAAEADASAKVAADAVSAALAARDEAAAARGGAEDAMREAGVHAGEAEFSATGAGVARAGAEAAQVKAEQAKDGAELAKVKAEQEAAKAERNAALLGDAALKGGDNTFTGLNSFDGEVAGVLPWDFHAYSWCKNKEELWAACPDIEQRRVFCADLSSMNISNQWLRIFPDNILKLNLYYSGDILGDYCLTNKAPDIAIFAPNATKCGHIMVGGWMGGKRLVVYAPNCNFYYRVCAATYMKSVTYITKMTQVTTDTLGNGTGYTEEVIMPFNVVTKVTLEQFTNIKNVPYGFPHATYINFNQAKLNKESVMAILNDLQPYDAATMTTVPELSIGIDPTLDGDEEINAALLNAQESVENGGKGWNVAVAGFTVTAGGGATMALRKPIYAMKREDAEGAYIDADGTRWSARYGNTVLENWAANEELGYTEFPNLESALEEWGLTEYVPEVPEESLTENK